MGDLVYVIDELNCANKAAIRRIDAGLPNLSESTKIGLCLLSGIVFAFDWLAPRYAQSSWAGG